MRDEDRYLFDLQGYLVVPDALGPGEVAELNEVVDAMAADDAAGERSALRFGNLLPRHRAFRDLIDNASVLPVLEELLGEDLRLDHDYLDIIRTGEGPLGCRLHGGATPFNPAEYYLSGDGRLHSGLFVVAYNLRDVGPEDGGFACVPGSHKAAFPYPEDWKDLARPHDCVRRVSGAAGTAILFTEALVHGTLPWRADHERRTVFYKYSPAALAWSRQYYDPNELAGLTTRQRDLLRSPGLSPAVLFPSTWLAGRARSRQLGDASAFERGPIPGNRRGLG
ncbi:MAG TPA: phytanoyl-CoA dioxygenase family protein [Acidimicrobiales bacterium]|nr:phytanoyl-CoA dioxygenase family protein [Acidimicrobiales bacterium]